MSENNELALFGGPQAMTLEAGDIFDWPIITQEDEEAVLKAMQRLGYFEEDTFLAFEQEFAAWCGAKFALSHDNGTAALLAALFACGVGYGDEVIVPGAARWNTVLPCFRLGATMVFADIDPQTLNIDPQDIEHRITKRTKAIAVLHRSGYPADMDEINAIAKRYHLYVIEDASHAHGSLYKGRKAGTLADISVFSFRGKPIALGEGGMLVTNERALYERALAWGHNFRFNHLEVHDPELLTYAGLPMGGVTTRMHNLSAELGRVQLKHYDLRMQEIDCAMNYFWDLLADIEGLLAHRPPVASGSTMGGWHRPLAIYLPEKFAGLPISRFVQAICAEGYNPSIQTSFRELYLHPLVNMCDIYHQGKPTRIANTTRDVRQWKGSLPKAENVSVLTVPSFRRFSPEIIEAYAACFRKVARNYEALLEGAYNDN